MSNLGLLVKVSFENTFELNNFFNKKIKKSSKKNFAAGSSLIVTLGIIAALVTIYFWMMSEGLKMVGMLDVLPLLSGMVCVLITLFTTIFKAQGILFASKDFESLMSLPIKPETILASKVIELLILNYLFSAVVIIPSTIVYYIQSSGSFLVFVYSFIGMLFLPLLPVVIASLIAFGLSYVSSKFKAKNTVLIIITLIFFVLVFIGSYKLNDIVTFFMARKESIVDGVKIVCPPAYYFAHAITDTNFISMVILILISLIPFSIFTIVFGKSFKIINLRLGESYKKSNYIIRKLKVSSKMGALIRREAKGYFSSSVYFLNTSVGMILLTVAAIGSIFLGGEGLVMFLAKSSGPEIQEAMPMLLELIQFLPLVIIIFCVSLTCTTGCAISLEGINLWIIKSLPIKPMEILISKIALNLLIVLPITILDICIFAVSIKLSALNLVFTFLIAIELAILVAISGIIINLHFPRLNWVNKTQVVKQSVSSMLSMFWGMIVVGIAIVGCFIIYNVFKITNIYVYLFGITLFLMILLIIAITILKVKGETLFNRLSL